MLDIGFVDIARTGAKFVTVFRMIIILVRLVQQNFQYPMLVLVVVVVVSCVLIIITDACSFSQQVSESTRFCRDDTVLVFMAGLRRMAGWIIDIVNDVAMKIHGGGGIVGVFRILVPFTGGGSNDVVARYNGIASGCRRSR